MNKIISVASAVLLFGLLASGACKKPADNADSANAKQSEPTAIVVFSVGEAKVQHADLTEDKASLGTPLKQGDKLQTKANAKVDIQFADGSAVRVSENSELEFASLALNTQGNTDTRLSLVSGKVFAKVNKANKNDQFSVITPTAIAGVRGTSFVVDRTRKDRSVVKVLEGSVAVSPRVRALEGMSAEEISANADLKKIKDSLDKSEVILEKDESSLVKASDKTFGEKEASKLNASLEKDIPKAVTKISGSGVSKSEEQEIRTIVTLDKDSADKLAKLSIDSGSGKVDQKTAADNEVERKKIEAEVAKRQAEEVKRFKNILVSAPKNLKTKQDLVNYYEKLEKIVLVNKTVLIGAIVDQQGSTMIVHTEDGIKKINQDEVQEVIYDFQTKSEN
ncbi:lipoprotein LipL45 [Leptospira wolffii]|uniref:lipoprotein LipL45 n=1 Tax=Leptospira wolffii TaxID=409998 RepID=UPI001083F44E|nr:lipoprotein LipL45 [Leptospira wolffii]TGK59979.1 lipoprotein LipL45 [Leptospira wolffii]TGK70031.1 lipoprotein LipL45 [Leptospira wolffii]TGK75987.1 lipoprotein LipL45 [Leptospira wolffii]TGL30238.1 lipoprotein LipL45 [Leptospira wolffii]